MSSEEDQVDGELEEEGEEVDPDAVDGGNEEIEGDGEQSNEDDAETGEEEEGDEDGDSLDDRGSASEPEIPVATKKNQPAKPTFDNLSSSEVWSIGIPDLFDERSINQVLWD